MSAAVIALLFCAAAFVYSMAGFGGGSTYLAVLTMAGFPHDRMPVVALVCNLVVVSAGAYHFARARHFDWAAFWPFSVGSIPLALVGGRLPLGREVFLLLLGVTLAVAGALLLWPAHPPPPPDLARRPPRGASLVLGAGIGLLSGMVGIGGGIFLAPLLLHLRWAPPKQVAALSAMFILVNSAAGLAGQLLKHPSAWQGWDWLVLGGAVFVGGQIGSRLGAWKVPQGRIRQLTGLIVLAAAWRILAVRLFP